MVMEMIPVIASVDQLNAAIEHGEKTPSARWYVMRRAVQLGADDRIPDSWLEGMVAAFTGDREKAAESGDALPDGSFPIPNVSFLKRAIKAYGRAKDKPKAKRHIIKRAKALGATEVLPDDWKQGIAASAVVASAEPDDQPVLTHNDTVWPITAALIDHVKDAESTTIEDVVGIINDCALVASVHEHLHDFEENAGSLIASFARTEKITEEDRTTLNDALVAGVRHVRTPEGAKFFDQPIGSVIVPNVYLPVGRKPFSELKSGDLFDLHGTKYKALSDAHPSSEKPEHFELTAAKETDASGSTPFRTRSNVPPGDVTSVVVDSPGGSGTQLYRTAPKGAKAALPSDIHIAKHDDPWYVSKSGGYTQDPQHAVLDSEGKPYNEAAKYQEREAARARAAKDDSVPADTSGPKPEARPMMYRGGAAGGDRWTVEDGKGGSKSFLSQKDAETYFNQVSTAGEQKLPGTGAEHVSQAGDTAARDTGAVGKTDMKPDAPSVHDGHGSVKDFYPVDGRSYSYDRNHSAAEVDAAIAELPPSAKRFMQLVGDHHFDFFDEGITEGSGNYGKNMAEQAAGKIGVSRRSMSGIMSRLVKDDKPLWKTMWESDGNDNWWTLTSLGADVANELSARGKRGEDFMKPDAPSKHSGPPAAGAAKSFKGTGFGTMTDEELKNNLAAANAFAKENPSAADAARGAARDMVRELHERAMGRSTGGGRSAVGMKHSGADFITGKQTRLSETNLEAKGSHPDRFVPRLTMADGETPKNGMNVSYKKDPSSNGQIVETYQHAAAVRFPNGKVKTVSYSQLNSADGGSSAPAAGSQADLESDVIKATDAPAKSGETAPAWRIPVGSLVDAGGGGHRQVMGTPVVNGPGDVAARYRDSAGQWDYVTPDTQFKVLRAPVGKPIHKRFVGLRSKRRVSGKA